MIYFNEAKVSGKFSDENNQSNSSLNLVDSGVSKFSQFGKDSHNKSVSLLLKNDLNFSEANSTPVVFTSDFNWKTFEIIKKHFKSLFKVKYPEEFFENVYKKKIQSVIGFTKDSKEIICFSHIEINKKDKIANILTLGVVKEYQGKKLGSKILTKIIEELTLMGIMEISLIVQEINEVAIKLYKKFGFSIEKTLHNYYSLGREEDNSALLMIRKSNIKKIWIVDLFQKLSNCLF